jgi:hypothetical protein
MESFDSAASSDVTDVGSDSLANLKANERATHLRDVELGKSNVLINLFTMFLCRFFCELSGQILRRHNRER